MKQLALLLCLLLAGLQAHARGIRDDANMASEPARTSYALGMIVGFDFLESGLEVDFAAFIEGMMAAMGGDEGAFLVGRYEAWDLAEAAFDRAMEAQADAARISEELFLAANAAAPGVRQTASGLQFAQIEEGDGPRPGPSDVVIVHYEGTFTDGAVFDSSYMRGSPEIFPLDMVIPGWSEGIQLMSVGSVYRLYIPSRLAYGAQGAGQLIPPFATLVFTVELLGILDGDDFFWE